MQLSNSRIFLIMTSLVLSSVMASLDSSFTPIAIPDMIDKLRSDFDIKHPYQMIKFDDTPMGIKEANNGGYWSVGVVKWSSLMEITDPDDIMEKGLMASDEYREKFQKAEEKLVNTGSDFVIQELPEINHVFREIYTHILYEYF